jgi:FkbM family methyltransferase
MINIKKFIPYKIKVFYKKNFRNFYALKNIDEKMLKYINYKNGFFLEIGAHDGIHNSNTFYFEKNLNWSGILIEPSNYYNHLIKNRSKKNKFFNCGCSDNENTSILEGDGDFSLFSNEVDDEFYNWYKSKNNLKNKKKIKLVTLNSILINSEAPKIIDFFSLDVEGMEIQVLKGLNFDEFNFKFLVVECYNKEKFKKINNFLCKKNYSYVDHLTPWDALFKFKLK